MGGGCEARSGECGARVDLTKWSSALVQLSGSCFMGCFFFVVSFKGA